MMSKQIIYILPLFTIIIGRILPAGLAIYWVLTSMVMILQQWYINSKFQLGFWGKFPEVPVSELPEYTIDSASTPEGTELHPEHEKLIKSDEKKIRAKGVEITVRKRK